MSQIAVFFRQGGDEEEHMLDRVFKQVYIPRSLEEVEEYERDHDRLAGIALTVIGPAAPQH